MTKEQIRTLLDSLKKQEIIMTTFATSNKFLEIIFYFVENSLYLS